MRVVLRDVGSGFEILDKGISLAVAGSDGGHLGNLHITKSALIWCKGKTRKQNGVKMRWDEFNRRVTGQESGEE